jgi:nondiscriminating glutamyl-tRNA synthetase
MKTQKNQPQSNKVRVRFAPSPTGYLHVGGARTAFYNYLYALKHEGHFIIRVEDTDEARSTKESLISMIEDMKWLKMDWDEGPIDTDLNEKGDKGPYLQSQRKEIYKSYLQKLLDSGKAYYCFLTEEELDKQRAKAKEEGRPFRPESPYRDWPIEKANEKIASGEVAALRFKNNLNKDTYDFLDLVRGEIKLPANMIGDFVVARSSGTPVYNFVCAIDDALMEITHVFRAEEHLNNTLRQLMIMEALGFTPPKYGHLSIMLGQDKQKLSKRHGAASVSEFKEEGYLPEALTNFIALMGWSSPSGKEILTREEMIKDFSSERFNPASAVFDKEKLKWMNAQYLRSMSFQDFWAHMKSFIPENWSFPESEEWKKRSFDALKTSMSTFKDGVPTLNLLKLGGQFDLDEQSKDVLSWESTPLVIKTWTQILKSHDGEYITEEQVGDYINQTKDQSGAKGKFLFMPIRVASIGKAQGIEIKELIPLIPVSELIMRSESFLGQ